MKKKTLTNLKVREISILFDQEPAVDAARVLMIKNNARSDEDLRRQIRADLEDCKRLYAQYRKNAAWAEFIKSGEFLRLAEQLGEQKAREQSDIYAEAAALRESDARAAAWQPNLHRRKFINLPPVSSSGRSMKLG